MISLVAAILAIPGVPYVDEKSNDGASAAALVRQLGSTSFRKREAASEQIRILGWTATPTLLPALESEHLEVQRRALKLVQCISVPEIKKQSKIGYEFIGKMALSANTKASRWAFFVLFRGDLRGEVHASAVLQNLQKIKRELVTNTKQKLFRLPKDPKTLRLVRKIDFIPLEIARLDAEIEALPKSGKESLKKPFLELKRNSLKKSLDRLVERVDIMRYEILGKMLSKMPNEGLPTIAPSQK